MRRTLVVVLRGHVRWPLRDARFDTVFTSTLALVTHMMRLLQKRKRFVYNIGTRHMQAGPGGGAVTCPRAAGVKESKTASAKICLAQLEADNTPSDLILEGRSYKAQPSIGAHRPLCRDAAPASARLGHRCGTAKLLQAWYALPPVGQDKAKSLTPSVQTRRYSARPPAGGG